MKQYCMHCGSPLPHLANFCVNCGSATQRNAKAAAQHPHMTTPTDDDDVRGDLPDIDDLGIEVEFSTTNRGEKLQNLIGTAKQVDQLNRPKPKRVSKKHFFEQFKKDAGTERKQ